MNAIRHLLAALPLWLMSLAAFGQGTAFTYQGSLTDTGGPAGGPREGPPHRRLLVARGLAHEHDPAVDRPADDENPS